MRAIDADALIHELNNSHYPGAPYVDAGISIAIGKVCDAPTIEPERKKGKWTKDCACEICGFKPWYERDNSYIIFLPELRSGHEGGSGWMK